MKNENISTSALAKLLGYQAKYIFSALQTAKYITRESNTWSLTDLGKKHGGIVRSSQHGPYIAWPKTIKIPNLTPDSSTPGTKKLTAKTIGDQYNLSAAKINSILSELGWITRQTKGWKITPFGEQQGGLQKEDHRSGVPYVQWPESIIKSNALQETVNQITGKDISNNTSNKINNSEIGFRDRFKATYRSTDGHMVRSKAEMLIDNWLYMAEIVHAYERKLPIEEELYSDFYIPNGKVYIEYWGLENDPAYISRKQKKISLYNKYNFNLIELRDKEVQNLDDFLPKLLLKYNILSY